jgi:hypothetical protein
VPLKVPEATGEVLIGTGWMGSVIAGGVTVGPEGFFALALSAKMKERTAAAQSAIAEVKKGDFVFMARTLPAARKHRQPGAGNAIVTLVTERVGAGLGRRRTVWPNESFYEGNARNCVLFPERFSIAAGNSRVTSEAVERS